MTDEQAKRLLEILEPSRKVFRFYPPIVENQPLQLGFHALILKNAGNTNIAINGNFTLAPGDVIQFAETVHVTEADLEIKFGNINANFPSTSARVNRLEFGIIAADGENPALSKLAIRHSFITNGNNTNTGAASGTALPTLF